MADDRLSMMARRLAEARRTGARITLDGAPRDIEEGFAVQEKVVALLGEPVIGWKVIPLPDRPAIFAPLLAGGLVPAGGTWAVAGGQPAGIELEVAFRMGRDVPPGAQGEALLDCVGSAHVVLELCQSRQTEPDTLSQPQRLADCILNAGIVVGSEIRDWRRLDLKGIGGRLLVDGRPHAEGRSVDPVRALTALAPALDGRGKALRAGEVVITGSLIGMNWLLGRHDLAGEIDGCGTVRATLAA